MQWKSGWSGRLFFSALLATLSVGGCNCGGRSETSPTAAVAPPAKASTLRVFCPGEPAATIVGQYGAAWARRQGLKLQVVARSSDQATTPDHPTIPDADCDVWVLPAVDLARLVMAEQLLP